MGECAGAQVPVGRGQEHDTVVGQAGHHQLGHLIEQFIPVMGGGDQRPGPHQEREAFSGAAGLIAGGALAGQQLRAFPLGALARGQVHDKGHPAQRVPVDDRRADRPTGTRCPSRCTYSLS